MIQLSLFGCLLLAMLSLTTGTSLDQTNEEREESDSSKESRESFRSLLGGLSSGSSTKTRDLTALHDVIASGNWDRFTPAPVSNPDCHVEVQVVQKIPGRCIQLGRHHIPACQTQNWVSFNSEDCSSK